MTSEEINLMTPLKMNRTTCWWTIGASERRYQKPLECPLILGTYLHIKHPHLKPPSKEKNEGGRAKGDAKDFTTIRGATKFSNGEKPKR
jgi:hypothetical protein